MNRRIILRYLNELSHFKTLTWVDNSTLVKYFNDDMEFYRILRITDYE